MKLTPIDDTCESIMIGWASFQLEASAIMVVTEEIYNNGAIDLDTEEAIFSRKSEFSDAGNLN